MAIDARWHIVHRCRGRDAVMAIPQGGWLPEPRFWAITARDADDPDGVRQRLATRRAAEARLVVEIITSPLVVGIRPNGVAARFIEACRAERERRRRSSP